MLTEEKELELAGEAQPDGIIFCPVMTVPRAIARSLPGRMRILFLIRQLAVGGAERQLALLARSLSPRAV